MDERKTKYPVIINHTCTKFQQEFKDSGGCIVRVSTQTSEGSCLFPTSRLAFLILEPHLGASTEQSSGVDSLISSSQPNHKPASDVAHAVGEAAQRLDKFIAGHANVHVVTMCSTFGERETEFVWQLQKRFEPKAAAKKENNKSFVPKVAVKKDQSFELKVAIKKDKNQSGTCATEQRSNLKTGEHHSDSSVIEQRPQVSAKIDTNQQSGSCGATEHLKTGEDHSDSCAMEQQRVVKDENQSDSSDVATEQRPTSVKKDENLCSSGATEQTQKGKPALSFHITHNPQQAVRLMCQLSKLSSHPTIEVLQQRIRSKLSDVLNCNIPERVALFLGLSTHESNVCLDSLGTLGRLMTATESELVDCSLPRSQSKVVATILDKDRLYL